MSGIFDGCASLGLIVSLLSWQDVLRRSWGRLLGYGPWDAHWLILILLLGKPFWAYNCQNWTFVWRNQKLLTLFLIHLACLLALIASCITNRSLTLLILPHHYRLISIIERMTFKINIIIFIYVLIIVRCIIDHTHYLWLNCEVLIILLESSDEILSHRLL